jgi:ABC-type molybdate transport system substrate-binding protein
MTASVSPSAAIKMIASNAAKEALAKTLVGYLTAPQAAAAIRRSGMEPA